MRGTQARRQGVSSSSVPSHPPRPRHPCGRACRPRVLVPLSPHPLIPGKQAKRQEETRQGQDERQRGAAEAWRSRRSHPWIVSRRANENKQARRERRTASPHSYHLTTQRSSSHTPINQSPRSPDKHTRDGGTRRRDDRTTSERDEHGDDENDGRTTGRTTKRKRTGPARRQASNETRRRAKRERDDKQDAERDGDDKEKASSMRR